MSAQRPRTPEVDRFLSDLEQHDRADDAPSAAELGLLALCDGLPAIEPPAALRARLLDAAVSPSRLARFAEQVADLLDVGLDKARELLARIDDPAAWSHDLPGISFLWVEGGPRVAQAVRGFVRVQAGLEFPHHEHLGDEVTLVLQGAFEDHDRKRVFRPGDIDRMSQGTSHGFHVLSDGPDLLKLAVVQTGLRALGQTYLPR
jgi:quercetin dioxygenase-like cupin family protein